MSRRRIAACAASLALVAALTGACAAGDHPSAGATSGPQPGHRTSRSSTAVPATSPTTRRAPTSTSPTPSHHASTAAPLGQRLPLAEPTHGAMQVITVVASAHHDTTAVLQRWTKRSGGWRKVGDSVAANLGTDGMTRHPSESKSATPIGTFTLTRAFGHDTDPGTRLPYVHTTPDDWWISQPGPLYNTRQRCSSDCSFTQGDPNEHLYYETPAYDYAVVIDYNTRNAPGGVRQGRGSAFFLHVSEGRATAGCVSIPVSALLSVMQWLKPADHPRILIGTG